MRIIYHIWETIRIISTLNTYSKTFYSQMKGWKHFIALTVIVSRKCTVSWFPGKVHSYSHEPAFMSEGSTHVSCQMLLRLTRFYVPKTRWKLSDAKLLSIWGSVTSPHRTCPELMIIKPQVIEKVTGNSPKKYIRKINKITFICG